MVAVAMPALAVIAVGGVELARVSSQKAHMQEIADAAALSAASEAIVAPVGAAERAKAYALEALKEIGEPTTSSVVAVTEPDGRLRVTISGHRPSLLANLLPPGGWRFGAEAVAQAMNQAPLCVLAKGVGERKAIALDDVARINAGNCLIHSNEDVEVKASSSINAAYVRAGGVAKGNISPAPEAGAPELDDPFSSMSTDTSKACTSQELKLEDGSTKTLPAGVHCEKIEVSKSSTLILGAGEHYFRKELKIKEDAKLQGEDVVLFFSKDAKVKWQDKAKVSLEGRRTGAYTGFLIITDRGHTNDLDIWSDSVDTLLGVVYAPNAKLVIDGKEEVAEASDWTVVVAKAVQLKGSAKLTLNTNYAGSLVDVPVGVGPSSGAVRLGR